MIVNWNQHLAQCVGRIKMSANNFDGILCQNLLFNFQVSDCCSCSVCTTLLNCIYHLSLNYGYNHLMTIGTKQSFTERLVQQMLENNISLQYLYSELNSKIYLLLSESGSFYFPLHAGYHNKTTSIFCIGFRLENTHSHGFTFKLLLVLAVKFQLWCLNNPLLTKLWRWRVFLSCSILTGIHSVNDKCHLCFYSNRLCDSYTQRRLL